MIIIFYRIVSSFRAHHSCESTLILVYEHILNNIEQGLINGIALLLQKLELYGYGLYVALHKGYDEMGSGSDSRYFIYILQ